jgi:hypothetical protein
MKSPDTFEAELRTIRQELYEETKNMTSEERVAHLRAQTEPIMKKYNFHVIEKFGDH